MLLTYLDEDRNIENLKLSEKIAQDFGIEQGDYRLILGEMDILLDFKKRITSLEIRTNPLTWQPCSLLPIPCEPDAVFVNFVVDYDENCIASYDLPIRIMQDLSRHELSFGFGDFATSRWAVIADNLAVGMTADNHLNEFRLSDFIDGGNGSTR
ncbi:MAG: hypothetical protein WCI11_04285 [Candidatus Methylumidiphilus sp.]